MQFSIRAIMVAALLVAVAAVLIPLHGPAIVALPGCVWAAGVAIGVLFARGRGLRCILFAAIGGTLGAALAAGCIGFFDKMSFASWHGPVALVPLGGLGGAFIGCAVRVMMEGLTLKHGRRAQKDL